MLYYIILRYIMLYYVILCDIVEVVHYNNWSASQGYMSEIKKNTD